MGRPQTLSHRINQHLFTGLIILWGTLVLAIVLGVGIYFKNEQSHNQALDQAARIQNEASDLNHALLSEVLSTRAYLITGQEESLTDRDLSHQEAQNGLQALKSSLSSVPALDAADLQTLDQLHASYDALAAELIAMRQAGQTAEMASLFDSRSDPLVLRILDAEKGLQEDLQIWLAQVNQDFTGSTRQSILLIIVLLVAGAIAGFLALRQRLISSLQTLGEVEQAMADAAETQILRPVPLRAPAKEPIAVLSLAYNRLADRQAENKASRVQFQEKLAHDMNSVLASIQGYAELAAAAHQQPGADLEKIGAVLSRQTLRLGEMIADAITATRIYEDRLEMVYRPVHLGPLLASLVEEAAQQSGRPVAYQDLLAQSFISGDSLRLREAFSKILDNALRFSAPGSPVQVTIGRDSAQNMAEVRIEDRGIGIAEADLPALFKPFGRIRNEYTKGITGNGLSLYIARAIIEAHRGQITLLSQPGQGTTVLVTLPLEAEG